MVKIGQCQKCKEFFPPDFTIVIDIDKAGTEFHKCVYCESGKDILAYDAGDGLRDYEKKQCIEDYKILIGKIKNSATISQLLDQNK